MRHIGTYFASVLLMFACAHAEDGGEMDEDMSGGSAGNGGTAGKGGSMSMGAFAGVVGNGGSVSGAAGKGAGGAAGNVGTGGSGGGSAGTSNPAGGSAANSGGTAGTSGGTAGTTGGSGQGGSGGVAGNCMDLGMGGGPGSTGFTVRYKVENAGTPGTAIGAEIRIMNAGADTLQLSELTLHYYITNEVVATINKNVNWSFIEPNAGGNQNSLSGISLNVVPMCTPTATANAYIEISFGSGSLAPGNNAHFSWTVQNGASQNWNQTNDYSFDSSKTSVADWDHMVLRRNGLVIYGQDPT